MHAHTEPFALPHGPLNRKAKRATKGNMNGNEIVEAVEYLREVYPNDDVEIWAGFDRRGKETYTAHVGQAGSESMPSVFGYGNTPGEAAASCVKKAGARDPEKILQQRIAKLRDELAKLEAAQTPVVMES